MKPGGRQLFGVMVLLVAAALCAVGFYANRDFYHDDAFIGLRYARNLLSGDGLVWNQGERVEGYSNFLYTFCEAALGLTGMSLVRASRAISMAALLGLAVFMWVRGSAPGGWRIPEYALAMGPFVLVVTSFPLIVWALGGLEGPLFATLSAIGVWLTREGLGRSAPRRNIVAGGVLLGLACVTRMDGLLFVAASFVFLCLESRETRAMRLATFTGAFLAVFLPYYVWRFSYYGSALPNVFWVKATGPSWSRLQLGVKYVLRYSATPPYLTALVGLSVLHSIARRWFDRKMLYVLGTIVLYLSYVAYVGGDHMPAFRFVLPAVPLSAILVGAHLSRLGRELSTSTARVALVGILVLAGLQVLQPRVNPRYTDPAAFVGTLVGKHIAATWPPGSLVALNTGGSTPFYAEDLQFVDMLGLNDAHIARQKITAVELPWQKIPGHLKGDGAYVLSRRPDYIIVGPAEGTIVRDPWFLSDLQMSRDPRIAADYVLCEERLDVTGVAGFERYTATRDGVLTFTYYKRKAAAGNLGFRHAARAGRSRGRCARPAIRSRV